MKLRVDKKFQLSKLGSSVSKKNSTLIKRPLKRFIMRSLELLRQRGGDAFVQGSMRRERSLGGLPPLN